MSSGAMMGAPTLNCWIAAILNASATEWICESLK